MASNKCTMCIEFKKDTIELMKEINKKLDLLIQAHPEIVERCCENCIFCSNKGDLDVDKCSACGDDFTNWIYDDS